MADLFNEEDLKKLENEGKSIDKVIPINVSGVITYGFDDNRISMVDRKLGIQSYKEMMKKRPTWEDFEIPVGYEIHNWLLDPVDDILYPEYKLNESTGKYEGTIKSKTLQPNEFFILPTLWLMILLLRKGWGCNVNNGEFKPICELDTDDYDAKLRNMYFTPDNIYKEVFDNPLSYKMIGAYEVLAEDKLSDDLYIPNAEDASRFGYLSNLLDSKSGNSNSTKKSHLFLKKVIGRE